MTNALKNTLEKIRLPELVAEKVVSCGKLKRLILKGGDYLVHSCESVWDTGKDFEITLDDAHKTKIHLHHGSHKKIATDLPCCFANTITNPTLEVSRWRAYKPEAIFSFDDSITNSWIDSLAVRGERDGAPGFRQAQVGAIHSVLAHWSTSCEASTIVLPTGTGKTETMLGLSLSEAAGLTVVIVPTKDLRNQIAKNLRNWGFFTVSEYYLPEPNSLASES